MQQEFVHEGDTEPFMSPKLIDMLEQKFKIKR
jgi:hypothetical protein